MLPGGLHGSVFCDEITDDRHGQLRLVAIGTVTAVGKLMELNQLRIEMGSNFRLVLNRRGRIFFTAENQRRADDPVQVRKPIGLEVLMSEKIRQQIHVENSAPATIGI